VAALLGAFCFGLAAALQQREALRAADLRIADPRLLWRLAHRPLWVAGIVADGLSAVLQVLALSFGPVTLVQPLGVTGLLFAMPIAAVLRRQRIRARDLTAAVVVLAALSVLLSVLPTAGSAEVGTSSDLAWLLIAALAFDTVAVAVAALTPPRISSLTLAAGAGASFGIVAVLIRALLEMLGQPHDAASVVVSAVGIGLLAPVGFLLLQNAYRSGHFSGSLSTAVVIDPIAAVLGGAWVLNEPLPALPWQIVTSVACAGLVIAGITVLVRSPSHLLDPGEDDLPPRAAADEDGARDTGSFPAEVRGPGIA
jgi:drug/metabolite transporter (DMT)-like permease